MNRRESGYSELARIGAGVAGVYVTVGVEASADRDHIRRNFQHVGDNLRSYGFVSLTLRHRPDSDHDFAIDVELHVGGLRVPAKRRMRIDDLCLAEVVRAGVKRSADADPDHAAFRAGLLLFRLPLVPANQFLGELQHAGIIPGVIYASVGRQVGELLRLDEIAFANRVSRNAEFVAANVDAALQEPQVLHARISTIGTDGTLIRDDLSEIDARILEPVDARKDLRPDHATERLIARVSAAVVKVSRLNAGDHAIRVQGDTRIEERTLVPVRARLHVLGTSLCPLDGLTAGFGGGESAQRHLGIIRDLDAKATADIERLAADVIHA